jgi:hypothetical protein
MADAKAKSSIVLNASIHLTLSEKEAAALNEMTCYGIEPFLAGYKRCLGEHYIKPHEEGLRSLFKTIDKTLPGELSKLKKYKKALIDAKAEFDDK